MSVGATLLGLAPVVNFLPVESLDDAVAVIVEGKSGRGDDRDEEDRVDELLLRDVGAEIGRDPRSRDSPERGDDGEDPERHRADPEEIRDDVLREAGNQVEDEAD